MDKKLLLASMTIFFLLIQFGDATLAEDKENRDLTDQNDDLVDNLDEDDIVEIREYKRGADEKKKLDPKKWRNEYIKSIEEEFKRKSKEISEDAVIAARGKIIDGRTRRGGIPYFEVE